MPNPCSLCIKYNFPSIFLRFFMKGTCFLKLHYPLWTSGQGRTLSIAHYMSCNMFQTTDPLIRRMIPMIQGCFFWKFVFLWNEEQLNHWLTKAIHFWTLYCKALLLCFAFHSSKLLVGRTPSALAKRRNKAVPFFSDSDVGRCLFTACCRILL